MKKLLIFFDIFVALIITSTLVSYHWGSNSFFGKQSSEPSLEGNARESRQTSTMLNMLADVGIFTTQKEQKIKDPVGFTNVGKYLNNGHVDKAELRYGERQTVR